METAANIVDSRAYSSCQDYWKYFWIRVDEGENSYLLGIQWNGFLLYRVWVYPLSNSKPFGVRDVNAIPSRPLPLRSSTTKYMLLGHHHTPDTPLVD
jgi:hypothetical protein